jgi:hypothetical protein
MRSRLRANPGCVLKKLISELLLQQKIARRSVMNGRSWNGPSMSPFTRWSSSKEEKMKLVVIALSIAAFVASAPAVFAQDASSKTPGHEMQQKGPKKGSHGASGYSPGHQMHAKGSKSGNPGASGYAPGQTTGSNTQGMSGSSSKK